MSEDTILAKIEELSAERRKAWGDRNPERARELDGAVAGLYDDLRTERAQAQHGERREIVRRARIEQEQERFIADL